MQPKTAWLECRLNEEELREKGKSLARAEEEKTQNAAAKKAQMAIFKSKDDGLAAVIEKLTTEINNEREYRNVETSELPNYETNLMEIYRRDTGERISTRPLTTDELQLKFGFKKPEDEVTEFFQDALEIARKEAERLEKRKTVAHLSEIEEVTEEGAKLLDESPKPETDFTVASTDYLPDGPPGLADEQEEFVSREFEHPKTISKRIASGWTPEEIAAKDRRIAEKVEN